MPGVFVEYVVFVHWCFLFWLKSELVVVDLVFQVLGVVDTVQLIVHQAYFHFGVADHGENTILYDVHKYL